MALSTLFRRVLTAAFLMLGLAAAAAAFAVGFTSALTNNLADPASAPALRISSLQTLDENLGYGAYLRAYRDFLETGRGQSEQLLKGYSDRADLALATFLNASLTDEDRASAAALRALAAPFRRMALFGSATPETRVNGLAPIGDIERAYAALKGEIAKAETAAEHDRIDRVTDAFVWAQTMSVAALWLLTAMLFALAWFMHERLVSPIEILRSSVNGAAAGAMGDPVWGIDRDDEVGTLARAAERLRQAAMTAKRERNTQASTRLADGAERLEGDLARVAGAAMQAQARIEAASARAAKASQTAIEAAGLAAEGSARFAERAEATLEYASAQTNAVMGALMAAVNRLTNTAERLEQSPQGDEPQSDVPNPLLPHAMKDSDRFAAKSGRSNSDAVVNDLIADLEALERFIHDRKDIAGDKAVAMTSALLEAIGRLNAVADRISTSADPKARAAR